MLAVSILGIKENIKENIKKLDDTNIDYFHLDIMDGKFVSNKTWDIYQMKKLIENVKKPLDVHLMVEDVYKYVDWFANLNPEYITFHYEACNNVLEVISYISRKKVKVGMAIKPNTKIDEIIDYLPFLDMVLVMSVEPGYGGQKFMDSAIDKINTLKKLQQYHQFKIEVDGGINDTTSKLCKNADILVVGSFITNYPNYEDQIKKILF